MKNEQLINELVADLTPVKPLKPLVVSILVWLLLSAVITIAIAGGLGDYRNGSMELLFASGAFLYESIMGMISITILAYYALTSAFPDRQIHSKFGHIVLMAFPLFWFASYGYGIVEPTTHYSEEGKRVYCYLETMVMAILPLFLGLAWAKKAWPVKSWKTGLLFGLSAGLMAAMVMQFACMYDAKHALLFHVLPGLFMGGVGLVLAKVMLKPK